MNYIFSYTVEGGTPPHSITYTPTLEVYINGGDQDFSSVKTFSNASITEDTTSKRYSIVDVSSHVLCTLPFETTVIIYANPYEDEEEEGGGEP